MAQYIFELKESFGAPEKLVIVYASNENEAFRKVSKKYPDIFPMWLGMVDETIK